MPICDAKKNDTFRMRISNHQYLFDMILFHQNGNCFLCGEEIDTVTVFGMNDDDRPSFDHVTPKDLGGRNIGNLLAAHRGCNNKKANRPPYPCELLLLEAVNFNLKRHKENRKHEKSKRHSASAKAGSQLQACA